MEPIAEQADGARIAVGKNRLRTVALAHLLQPRGDRIQRFVPGDALKRFVFAAALEGPLATPGFRRERIENAIGRVHAIEIFGHLAAKKALRHRMRRIALQLDRAALIHRHQNRAAVRAVVRAHRVHDAEWRAAAGGHGINCKLNPDSESRNLMKRSSYGFACGSFFPVPCSVPSPPAGCRGRRCCDSRRDPDPGRRLESRDIPAFMQSYEDSADTTFIGLTVRKGYQPILERYQRTTPRAKRWARSALRILMSACCPTRAARPRSPW